MPASDLNTLGLEKLLPFPQAFFNGFEKRTQKVFDQPPLPRFDFNCHGHPRRKIHLFALDLDCRAVHADPGRIDQTDFLDRRGIIGH